MNLFRSILNLRSKHQRLLTTFLAVAAFHSANPAFAAPESDFSIGQVQAVEIEQQQTAGITRMSFSGFGQTFNLRLTNNDALTKNFKSNMQGVDLYAGTIEGVDGSWARISRVNGELSGAIFDGIELYMLDRGDMIADSVENNLQSVMQQSEFVLYKASGIRSSLTCGIHDEEKASSAFSYEDLVSELQQQSNALVDQSSSPVSATATATRQVNLSIVADTQYVATSPNGAQAQVLSQMNIIDGIFTEQVGVQFGITEIDVLTNNGPLTSTNASTLLRQYQSFVGGDNPGLSHLFTGRNVDGNVIGIAFVSAICTANGVGVTQAGGRGTLGALTAAHEFGHNFGSPHDNQGGSACVSTAGTFLMNPSLNGSDQFSQCSLTQIDNTLRVRSQCLVDVTPPAPEPEPEPTPEPEPEPTPAPAPAPTPPPTPAPTPAPAPTPDGDRPVLNVGFNRASGGFSFQNDSSDPIYSAGRRLPNGGARDTGALSTVLGGVDNADITNLEANWTRSFNSPGRELTLTIVANLVQASDYEANEISEIGYRIDGQEVVLNTVRGNGNGGSPIGTGFERYDVPLSIGAGSHNISLFCRNSQKTFNNETTSCVFDRVLIR